MRRVELDDDSHRGRVELGGADIGHATSRLPVVPRRHAEDRALEIHYHPVRGLEREVVYVDRRVYADDDLGATRRWNNADRPDGRCVQILMASRRAPDERESGASRQELPHCVLTLVESEMASDSCRL